METVNGALRQARERILDAGLWLVSGRPRQEVLTSVLGALGAAERTRGDAHARMLVRDHLLGAALWLVAGRPREEVARALVHALAAADPGAAAPPADPSRAPAEPGDRAAADGLHAELWRHRLATWRELGGASATTALADRILESAAAEPAGHGAGRIAFAFRDAGHAGGRGEADPPAEWRLSLEVSNGAVTTVIPADVFQAIEQEVRWVSSPDELVGIVGGRPLRVTGSLVYARRAVRYHGTREEVLLPFGGIRLRVEAA
jgi:hypothetical protein